MSKVFNERDFQIYAEELQSEITFDDPDLLQGGYVIGLNRRIEISFVPDASDVAPPWPIHECNPRDPIESVHEARAWAVRASKYSRYSESEIGWHCREDTVATEAIRRSGRGPGTRRSLVCRHGGMGGTDGRAQGSPRARQTVRGLREIFQTRRYTSVAIPNPAVSHIRPTRERYSQDIEPSRKRKHLMIDRPPMKRNSICRTDWTIRPIMEASSLRVHAG